MGRRETTLAQDLPVASCRSSWSWKPTNGLCGPPGLLSLPSEVRCTFAIQRHAPSAVELRFVQLQQLPAALTSPLEAEDSPLEAPSRVLAVGQVPR